MAQAPQSSSACPYLAGNRLDSPQRRCPFSFGRLGLCSFALVRFGQLVLLRFATVSLRRLGGPLSFYHLIVHCPGFRYG